MKGQRNSRIYFMDHTSAVQGAGEVLKGLLVRLHAHRQRKQLIYDIHDCCECLLIANQGEATSTRVDNNRKPFRSQSAG